MPNSAIRRLHEAVVTGERPKGKGPRDVISKSWRRSLDAGIDPEMHAAPLIYDAGDIRDARTSNPMNALVPLLSHTLLQIADETAHIMVITDADGDVLWRDGHRQVLRHADRIGLADGFRWAEQAVGTNGIGTALATGVPTHVYSAEHLALALHEWSCAGAPVVDPDSGRVLGCLDISGTARALHPATVALVAAAARLAESQLTLRMRERDERLRTRHHRHLSRPGALVTPTGRIIGGDQSLGPRIRLPEAGDRVYLPDGRMAVVDWLGDAYRLVPVGTSATPRLTLTLLGADHPFAYLDDVRVTLSLRHAEILTLLASHPRGLTAERLSFLLYGDEGNPVTIRAEIHRLRAQLSGAIAAKPYRLTCEVAGDFLEVRQALTKGDLPAVARLYQGPLLPRSETPAIRRARDELEARVRSELLAKGTAEDLWAYAQTSTGHDDFEVLERLVAALPPGDQRRAAAVVRLNPAYE
ncbi:GAF domain-containing protein [Planotetraspora sp. A-T 1434]|uniref:helix-turn-helix domain-containing protein n=1 Tax=Planotetraspora sp. A-T 1434 TaxID=2979219 RepID=UPI0021BE4385|nr:helix-turn-helix domain-containing protein [Planotetraspora sp. A-T 1434]MCT9935178.1 GAF domain-containing protein [Planotetraspora sp. A-T 1434]